MHNQATTTKPKKECACYAKIWCEICKNSQCNDGYYVAAIQPIPIKHGSESSQSGLSAKHLKHLDHQALMHSILSICYDYPIYIYIHYWGVLKWEPQNPPDRFTILHLNHHRTVVYDFGIPRRWNHLFGPEEVQWFKPGRQRNSKQTGSFSIKWELSYPRCQHK